jgi:hypothetical protein
LRRGIGFQLYELAVEPVRVLIAFNQEFLDQIVHHTTLFALAAFAVEVSASSRLPEGHAVFTQNPLARETCSSSSNRRIPFNARFIADQLHFVG